MGHTWSEIHAICMGGATKGPTTKAGKERASQAVFRHGGRKKETIDLHKKAMALTRKRKDILQLINHT